ncbi:MAG TPA: GvpL/GvpF family gas vesicle protein [Pyrinomonadaceae bacterium]|jgi:hypothetical protein
MSLYVYCLGEGLAGSAFEGLAGVGGATPWVLALGDFAAVVSEASEGPTEPTELNLLAHNRVNAAALAGSTPLPFRFGTRASRERLAEYAGSNRAALAAALERVRGRVEMGVKLMEKAAGEGQEAQGEAEGRPEVSAEGAAAVGRGTAFLLQKRREVLGEEDARRRAEELAAWLAAGVAGLVREADVRLNPSGAIAVRAAHLVERVRVAEYRERLRALAAGREGLRLLSSGPWPPYSFSDIGGTMKDER